MNESNFFTSCISCDGQGKKKARVKKKTNNADISVLNSSDIHINCKLTLTSNTLEVPCKHCKGTGIVETEVVANATKLKYPKIAIIGAGIGGVALAVACLHRGIPFTLYERDIDFNARSQGYGLTLQQASKAMGALGIHSLAEGIVSTKHVVHATDGTVLGEWGMRKWGNKSQENKSKKTNIHIARQSLRAALLQQLGGVSRVAWGHQLLKLEKGINEKLAVTFKVENETKTSLYDLVVGADGIRSTVRNFIFKNEPTPLRYLNCMVVLGICKLSDLKHLNSSLLDGATVFQTANGNDRIYVMPFDKAHVMWQLSFPVSEDKAKEWYTAGALKLKEEAVLRTQWHNPVPEIVTVTPKEFISGYPVYDREVLSSNVFDNSGAVTLVGDAAHPMSPFKGQGANQAILDALSLARNITKSCRLKKQTGTELRVNALSFFEQEMLSRSAVKVKASADAAELLHTEKVLLEGNRTRGSFGN